MKYINCDYLYYAENLNEINVVDPLLEDHEFEMKDIALLRYKNFISKEQDFWHREEKNVKTYNSLTSEFIIADTDINAISYYMNKKLYITSDLCPVIRYENIKNLLKVIRGYPFLLKEKDIGAILFNSSTLETKYIATNTMKDLYENDLLTKGYEVTDAFTSDEIKRFDKKFKKILKKSINKHKLENIFQINMRVNDMRELQMTDLIKEISPTIKIRNVLGIFEDRFYSTEDVEEKKRLVDFYAEIGHSYFDEYDQKMEHYRAFSLTQILTYLSLGRIDREVISRANVIHDSHQQGYAELFEFKDFYFKQLSEF